MSSISTLLDRRTHELHRLSRERQRLVAQQQKAEDEIAGLGKALILAEKCLASQVVVKSSIEQLVTALLTAVFDEPIEFVFTEKLDAIGDVVGLSPTITRRGRAYPYSRQGGGLSNLMGFGIRLSYMLLIQQGSPVLLLDEPNINLDRDKWRRLIEFVEDLTSNIDLQILMISHTDARFATSYGFDLRNRTNRVKAVV